MNDTHTDDWWDCPSCGGDTRVRRGPGGPTGRECTDCDWSVTIPAMQEAV